MLQVNRFKCTLSLQDQYDRNILGYSVVLPSGQKVKVSQSGSVSLGFFPKGEHSLKIESVQPLE